eukprot:1147894-Pelagomonas_calceolata.AAC.2
MRGMHPGVPNCLQLQTAKILRKKSCAKIENSWNINTLLLGTGIKARSYPKKCSLSNRRQGSEDRAHSCRRQGSNYHPKCSYSQYTRQTISRSHSLCNGACYTILTRLRGLNSTANMPPKAAATFQRLMRMNRVTSHSETIGAVDTPTKAAAP